MRWPGQLAALHLPFSCPPLAALHICTDTTQGRICRFKRGEAFLDADKAEYAEVMLSVSVCKSGDW